MLCLFAKEVEKSCGNKTPCKVLLYCISLNDRQQDVGSQKVCTDFKHFEDDISKRKKKIQT